ncbi:FAD/NAD(P)-binding domain superfamily [Fusarium oxysporum f. sp. vasinfectum]|nr:hypothetical protein FOTG_15847 [Fusarium oxysporum f. sp. vasinfectum 25433]KAK2682038.1 FAD/NAD(P)-binding domain superfamily [Fusarium oxysporum f. sp. vasinfectum]KAK2933525.1 FAD/NADP-binding domain superfamily [Fusarium oxysporum f. sp. vasinfectum]
MDIQTGTKTTVTMMKQFVPTPAVPLENVPGSLPETLIPPGIDANAVLSSAIENLSCLKEDHLWNDALWRDILAFTGIFRTFNSSKTIAAAWNELQGRVHPSSFKYNGGAQVIQVESTGWIEGSFQFDVGGSHPGKAFGFILLVPIEGTWKIWILSTMLESVDGLGNPDTAPRLPRNGIHGPVSQDSNGIPQGVSETTEVLIVGAGQNGICVAARLKGLGVKTVLIESEDEVGDNWSSRYDSVTLHTGKYYAHLPFETTFAGDEWPYFLRGVDLAKGYRDYVKRYQLDVRTSTTVEKAKWLQDSDSWLIETVCKGKCTSIGAKHIVFAMGAGGQQPKMPHIPNREAFKGISIHSKEYESAKQWKGKKGVVIGTANTGHDVAVDMVEAGLASVHMVQRNPTPVIPWPWFGEAHNRLYHPKAITIESDRRELGLPLSFSRNVSMLMVKKLSAEQPEKFDALERAGFKVDRLPDALKIQYERQGGHYLDMGGSQMIIDGKIKVKSEGISRFVPEGLGFQDGSILEADVIVWCTGFENDMRTMISDIVGTEIVERIEHHWYLDKEGEIRGAFKPVGHPGMWYTGGGVCIARFYSRFLALQIKADLAGVPFEPYRKTPEAAS